MGTRLFSKLKCGIFPDLEKLATKIEQAYNAYLNEGTEALELFDVRKPKIEPEIGSRNPRVSTMTELSPGRYSTLN